MAITSTEAAELLGWSTADGRYTQLGYVLPYIEKTINDYCNGGFARQVKEEEETVTATSSTGVNQLAKYPVIRGTVYVTSTDRGTYYYGDTQFGDLGVPEYYIPSTYVRDYEVDYSTGGFFVPSSNSQIGSTDTVYVTYAYVDIRDGGKLACAKMAEQAINQGGGIASESVGALSRSYTNGTMDPFVRSLLAPYRRPKVV